MSNFNRRLARQKNRKLSPVEKLKQENLAPKNPNDLANLLLKIVIPVRQKIERLMAKINPIETLKELGHNTNEFLQEDPLLVLFLAMLATGAAVKINNLIDQKNDQNNYYVAGSLENTCTPERPCYIKNFDNPEPELDEIKNLPQNFPIEEFRNSKY